MLIVQSVIQTKSHSREAQLEYVILNPGHENTLFIYPDDLETLETPMTGPGIQALRPYNRHGLYKSRPRSVGIPTGTMAFGPFNKLTDIGVKEAIDTALSHIRHIIASGHYTKIYFPATIDDCGIGSGRFGQYVRHGRPPPGARASIEVEDYITKSLLALQHD